MLNITKSVPIEEVLEEPPKPSFTKRLLDVLLCPVCTYDNGKFATKCRMCDHQKRTTLSN